MKSLKILTAFLLLLLCWRCSKSSTSPSNKSKTQLLTQKPWVQSNEEKKIGANDWVIDPSWISTPSCERDDNIVFRVDGTYEANEGPTKCNSSDDQVYDTGNWTFLNEERNLKTTGRQGTGPLVTTIITVEQLDEDLLVVSVSQTTNGVTTIWRSSYKHP